MTQSHIDVVEVGSRDGLKTAAMAFQPRPIDRGPPELTSPIPSGGAAEDVAQG
jgi:hypothetical protein